MHVSSNNWNRIKRVFYSPWKALKQFLALTKQRCTPHFWHLMCEYPLLHWRQRCCFSWNSGKCPTWSNWTSCVGLGTDVAFRFLEGTALALVGLADGRLLGLEASPQTFPALVRLTAMLAWNFSRDKWRFAGTSFWPMCLLYNSQPLTTATPMQ